MGLEDRDWYREEPSRAWREQRVSSGVDAPRLGAPTARGPRRWVELGLLAAVVTVGVTLVGGRLGVLELIGSAEQAPAPVIAPNVARSVAPPTTPDPSSRTVILAPSPELDVPATVVRRWWISDPRFGRIAVVVPIGRTPRDAITVELAARGFQVVTVSGSPSAPGGAAS